MDEVKMEAIITERSKASRLNIMNFFRLADSIIHSCGYPMALSIYEIVNLIILDQGS